MKRLLLFVTFLAASTAMTTARTGEAGAGTLTDADTTASTSRLAVQLSSMPIIGGFPIRSVGTDGDWETLPSVPQTRMSLSSPVSAGGCSYLQANDDPHVTSPDVSIHGWWQRVAGACPSQNKVTVGLLAFYCDYFCGWVQVAQGSGNYYQGPGSGRWANARKPCAPMSDLVSWAGWTDVDLIGINDPPGVTYSRVVNFFCEPG